MNRELERRIDDEDPFISHEPLEEEVDTEGEEGESIDLTSSDLAMMLVNEEIQPLASMDDAHCERMVSLSRNGVGMDDGKDETSSLWVPQNVQKLSRMRRVSFDGIEDLVCSFFYEIYRRRMFKKNEGVSEAKDKKKQSEGTPRELKRLEFSINYDGQRKEDKKKGAEFCVVK